MNRSPDPAVDSAAAANAEQSSASNSALLHAPVGHWRWIICGLLFFATTFNYIDRQVIGLLKPTLQHELHWSETDYADIILFFQFAYAIGYLVMGPMIDWLGTRIGYTISALIWSFAAMAHAAARSVVGFGEARFALGLGEGGSFPASIKTVAEWFPRKERALATAVFNSGTNLGPIVAPVIIAWITLNYGWRWCFILTGVVNLLWIIPWLLIYRPPEEHKGVSAAELAYIRSDPAERPVRIPWARLLPHRQLWAIAIGKFLTDPVWWLFLFWIPDFLNRTHGLNLLALEVPLVVIYAGATVGSLLGGWLSGALIKRGWTVNASRKTAMFVCACSAVPIVFAARVSSVWAAVGLLTLSTAAHQGWSANLFTLSSDMFPRRAVGSVTGVIGTAGACGGMLIAVVVGYLLQKTGSYNLIFAIAGCAYLTALLVIHLIVPRLEPANLDAA
ncbi:MAG TPA: MFS transporter [Candidatus Acidoferrales bacterium]